MDCNLQTCATTNVNCMQSCSSCTISTGCYSTTSLDSVPVISESERLQADNEISGVDFNTSDESSEKETDDSVPTDLHGDPVDVPTDLHGDPVNVSGTVTVTTTVHEVTQPDTTTVVDVTQLETATANESTQLETATANESTQPDTTTVHEVKPELKDNILFYPLIVSGALLVLMICFVLGCLCQKQMMDDYRHPAKSGDGKEAAPRGQKLRSSEASQPTLQCAEL